MHAQSLQQCLTVCDPMDCSLPGFSFHEILQARVLEWIAMTSSRGCSQPRDQTLSPGSSGSPGKPPGAAVPGQPTCNGPNVCAPFHSYWRWVFKEVIKVKWGHKGGFSSSRIGDLVRRCIRELPLSLSNEDIARCGQASASWEETLTRNWKGWDLDLGPPASRTVRNNFLLLKPLSLWQHQQTKTHALHRILPPCSYWMHQAHLSSTHTPMTSWKELSLSLYSHTQEPLWLLITFSFLCSAAGLPSSCPFHPTQLLPMEIRWNL